MKTGLLNSAPDIVNSSHAVACTYRFKFLVRVLVQGFDTVFDIFILTPNLFVVQFDCHGLAFSKTLMFMYLGLLVYRVMICFYKNISSDCYKSCSLFYI